MVPRAWLAATTLVLAGCASGVAATTAGGGYVSGNGAITVVPPAEREHAPEVSGQALDGGRVSLADYAGKVVVVNVWGSWCGDCRAEAPDLAAVSTKLAGHGVRFLGIDIRDNQSSARAYESRYGLRYPSIFDPSSSQLLGFPSDLAPVAVPTTYVLDASGRLAARLLGSTTADTLTAVIADVQGSGPGG